MYRKPDDAREDCSYHSKDDSQQVVDEFDIEEKLIDLGSEIEALKAQNKTLTDALIVISKWDSLDLKFRVNYGSNGQREFYRDLARSAIIKSNQQGDSNG